MLRRLAPLALLVGVLCLLFGIFTYNQEAGAKPEPDVISAADLVAKGPPSNLHVRITDAAAGVNNVVTLTSKKGGVTTSEDVFLPLTTTPARFGDTPVLAAVVRMKRDELTAYRGGPLQGMKIKALFGLDSQVANLLAPTYGKDAVDKAFYVQYGRKPAGLGVAFALLGVGIVGLAAGILGRMQKPDPAAATSISPPPPAR